MINKYIIPKKVAEDDNLLIDKSRCLFELFENNAISAITYTLLDVLQKNEISCQKASNWDIENYTAFIDNGNLNNYKKLDEKYINSIFVLNTQNLYDWLFLRFMHGLNKHKNEKKHNWAFPPTQKLCDEWINDREGYHLSILQHFEYIKDITREQPVLERPETTHIKGEKSLMPNHFF